MRISILGTGMIGKSLTKMIKQNYAFKSCTLQLYDKIEGNDIKTFDLMNNADVDAVTKNSEYVINAIPIYDPYIVKRLVYKCLEHRTHYLDFSEDIIVGSMIENISNDAQSLVAPHCGLAPGMINILGNFLGATFDKTESIKMYVGALTPTVANDILYTNTWSAEGVANEYVKPCHVIKEGKLEKVQGFVKETFGVFPNGYEKIFLDGKEYEAFYTSGGCSTMTETWKGRAETIEYRSIRYPGHATQIANLYFHGKDVLEAIQKTKPLFGTKDEVLLYAIASGTKDGKFGTRERFLKFSSNDGMSAIGSTTCSGLLAVLEMHLKDSLGNGFLRQEGIDWNSFSRTSTIKQLFDRTGN